ncbi:MAG: DUF456 domain-containing protein [Bacteroidales bacterium]
MDTFIIGVGIVLLLGGLVGSVLPVLPGPPLSFLGLLGLRFLHHPAINDSTIMGWGIMALLLTLLDYYLPIWTTARLGGSKAGVNGAAVGLVVGIFWGPFGIILGPLLGAFVGEMLVGKSMQEAMKSGLGAFLGFISGIAAKIIYALAALGYFIWALL